MVLGRQREGRPFKMIIGRLRLSNINKCIALKLLEENLIHFISQRGNKQGGEYDQWGKRSVRHRLIL